MNNVIGTGAASILAGIFILMNFFNISKISSIKGFSFVMMFYGLITIVASFQKIKRSSIVFASAVLAVGIILYMLDNFEILNWYDLVLPSLLFVLSASFFILFIDNSKEFLFLITAGFFFVLSLGSVFFFDNSLVQLARRITLILFDYWPLFVVLFGVMLVLSKPGKDLSSSVNS